MNCPSNGIDEIASEILELLSSDGILESCNDVNNPAQQKLDKLVSDLLTLLLQISSSQIQCNYDPAFVVLTTLVEMGYVCEDLGPKTMPVWKAYGKLISTFAHSIKPIYIQRFLKTLNDYCTDGIELILESINSNRAKALHDDDLKLLMFFVQRILITLNCPQSQLANWTECKYSFGLLITLYGVLSVHSVNKSSKHMVLLLQQFTNLGVVSNWKLMKDSHSNVMINKEKKTSSILLQEYLFRGMNSLVKDSLVQLYECLPNNDNIFDEIYLTHDVYLNSLQLSIIMFTTTTSGKIFTDIELKQEFHWISDFTIAIIQQLNKHTLLKYRRFDLLDKLILSTVHSNHDLSSQTNSTISTIIITRLMSSLQGNPETQYRLILRVYKIFTTITNPTITTSKSMALLLRSILLVVDIDIALKFISEVILTQYRYQYQKVKSIEYFLSPILYEIILKYTPFSRLLMLSIQNSNNNNTSTSNHHQVYFNDLMTWMEESAKYLLLIHHSDQTASNIYGDALAIISLSTFREIFFTGSRTPNHPNLSRVMKVYQDLNGNPFTCTGIIRSLLTITERMDFLLQAIVKTLTPNTSSNDPLFQYHSSQSLKVQKVIERVMFIIHSLDFLSLRRELPGGVIKILFNLLIKFTNSVKNFVESLKQITETTMTTSAKRSYTEVNRYLMLSIAEWIRLMTSKMGNNSNGYQDSMKELVVHIQQMSRISNDGTYTQLPIHLTIQCILQKQIPLVIEKSTCNTINDVKYRTEVNENLFTQTTNDYSVNSMITNYLIYNKNKFSNSQDSVHGYHPMKKIKQEPI